MKHLINCGKLAASAVAFWGTLTFAGVNPNLTVAGDVLFSGPYAKQAGTNLSFNGKSAIGAGLIGGFTINETMGLEVGAFYLNRSFEQQNYDLGGGNLVSATFTNGFIHLPVLLRFNLLKILSVGIGGYYSQALGGWAANYSNGTTGSKTFDDLSLGQTDFGAVASVGVEVPISQTLSAIGDVRLTQSLTSSARANGDNWQYRDFHVLAGLKFNFNPPE